MTTLIIVGNSDGIRRCDTRYHGRGTAQAQEMLQDDVLAGRFGTTVAEAARETQGWLW